MMTTSMHLETHNWNYICLVAQLGASLGIARVIDKGVHKFFKAQENSYKSYAIKAAAFLGGAAVGIALTPYIDSISFELGRGILIPYAIIGAGVGAIF